MEYIKFLKSKKVLILAVGVIIVAGIAGFIFYSQKLPTYKLSIKPAELLPFVSHAQARATICDKMKGKLFDEICQEKFNSVGKNDSEKIGTLFLLLKKIENDQSISDYERLLLAQAIFASLPTKDSPLTQRLGFNELLAKLKNGVIGQSVAHAEGVYDSLTMGEEEFKKMMLIDLKNVVGNLPEGDNAWIIQVMVSKYRWINGEKQPIYSQVFEESFNSYPGVSTEDKSKWEKFDMTHVQMRVSAYASDQAMYSGSFTEGSGEMIAYSFSMASWKSKSYDSDSVLVVAESGPAQKYLVSRNDYSEENYEGDNLLSDLLRKVKMPDRYLSSEGDRDKKDNVSKTGASTAWGSANDDRETAYEAYFWMHLQLPTGYATFWETYDNTEGMGGVLRSLPLGEPVNLRDYFNTPGVRDYYEQVRKINASIPTLDEFLSNIDEYQTNLNLGKLSEPTEVKPADENTGEEEDKFEIFLRERYNQPIPKTQEEMDAFDRKFSDPNSPCYSETFKP